MGAREPRAHWITPRDIGIVQTQTDDLADAKAGVEDDRDHQPIARGAGSDRARDLDATKAVYWLP